MWVLQCNRQILIELLAGNSRSILYGAFQQDGLAFNRLKEDELYLLWESNPQVQQRVLPFIIIVPNGRIRDFFAWAITYLTSYRPFTAFFRVLDQDSLSVLGKDAQLLSLNEKDTACIGTIIAEASLLSLITGKRLSLTPNSCSGLLSYALTRALALSVTPEELQGVTQKWFIARKLSDQHYPSDLAQGIIEIYRTLAELNQLNPGHNSFLFPNAASSMVSACSEIIRDGRVSDNSWYQLTAGIRVLENAHENMQGTREERVVYFQHLMARDNLLKLPNVNLRDFLIGYLASLIGPGSLAHMDLVMKYVSSFPNATLWYGMCAGLQKKGDLLVSFNVLGRWLLRELLRKDRLFDPPSCDMSLPELQVIFEGGIDPARFPRFTSSRVVVELQPYIAIGLNWPKKTVVEETMSAAAVSLKEKESGQLFKDLGSHLNEALKIQGELLQRSGRNQPDRKGASSRKAKKNKL
jgi:hypothetical protein